MLRFFGPQDPNRRGELKKRMQTDKLPVRELIDLERKERQKEKDRVAEQKKAEKQARAMALGQAAAEWQSIQNTVYANLSTATGLADGETLDELLDQSSYFNPREIGKVVEDFGQKESDLANMPMADSPVELSTELLPYQRQGLAWMISRENPCLPAPGSNSVVQLWKRNGNRFTNVATNFSTSNAPPLASGGILADDMGLGKTIQIISLILANPAPRSSVSSKATLILAPVGVMSNWKNQIQDHTRSEATPRVLIYHGSGRKEAANLTQYDVVISSYGALVKDFNENSKNTSSKGIFSVHWRRVVLDEGHTIRNPRSKGSVLTSPFLKADGWA